MFAQSENSVFPAIMGMGQRLKNSGGTAGKTQKAAALLPVRRLCLFWMVWRASVRLDPKRVRRAVTGR
jgi:hypothetical protein